MDSESMRDEKVKVLKSIPALEAEDVVRGQFRGYRQERGVAADSQVETFAAVRLRIDSCAVAGRPVLHSRGKVPAGDVHGGCRPPAAAANGVFPTSAPLPNYFRFRFVPAADSRVRHHRDGRGRQDDRPSGPNSWQAGTPGPDEKAAYERVLADALEGDSTLFARMDYVEEAWRIVDPC